MQLLGFLLFYSNFLGVLNILNFIIINGHVLNNHFGCLTESATRLRLWSKVFYFAFSCLLFLQILDYLTDLRESVTDDHVVFGFEQRMELGTGDAALLEQVRDLGEDVLAWHLNFCLSLWTYKCFSNIRNDAQIMLLGFLIGALYIT